jgi:Asp-tRNA(Asn)/Glu-tRNA(Gln) amidotransferase C subunit
MTAAETPDFSPDLNALRQLAAFAGLSLSDQRLEELRPVLDGIRRSYARLHSAELHDVEPAITVSADFSAVTDP